VGLDEKQNRFNEKKLRSPKKWELRIPWMINAINQLNQEPILGRESGTAAPFRRLVQRAKADRRAPRLRSQTGCRDRLGHQTDVSAKILFNCLIVECQQASPV
jgi:hypothetical protein